jgi:hypothetical protein
MKPRVFDRRMVLNIRCCVCKTIMGKSGCTVGFEGEDPESDDEEQSSSSGYCCNCGVKKGYLTKEMYDSSCCSSCKGRAAEAKGKAKSHASEKGQAKGKAESHASEEGQRFFDYV